MRSATPHRLACLIGGTLAVQAAAATAAAAPPHIILIVADDLGWHDVGFRTNGQIQTKNIDGFAKDGLVLDRYYVQSVCSPSRATFMTGRYPLHHTVNDWLRNGEATGLPLNETMIPQKLAEAGYRSHMVGKWHLGFTSWSHTPTFRGFESFVGFYSGGENYFTHAAGSRFDFRRDMRPRCGKGCSKVAWEDVNNYSTHVFTQAAVRVVQEHDASKAPLFLYLAYQAVHAPSEVPDAYRDAYKDTIADKHRRTFAGMLTCMDEGIGNVTAALRAKGMLEHSLIIFSTDNGGPQFDTPGGDYVGSSNYPLRGGKHSIWEGGTRGTAVVWAGAATGLLPPARRGVVVDSLMHGADWFPTFCALAGVADSCATLPLDGVDQGGSLFGDGSAADGRHEIFYGQHDDAPTWHSPYDTALRDAAGWKLIQGWGGKPNTWSPETCEAPPVSGGGFWGYVSRPWKLKSWLTGRLGRSKKENEHERRGGNKPEVMLYNVQEDPGEHHELSAAHPDVVARLTARIEALRATAVDVAGGGGRPDPRCPQFVPSEHVDAHVGPVWEPWCDAEPVGIPGVAPEPVAWVI